MKNDIVPFDKTLKNGHRIYRFAALNIKDGEPTKTSYKQKFLLLINYLWLDTDLFGGIYWFIEGIRTGKDFIDLTYIAPCISLTTLGNLKGACFYWNEKNGHKLISKIRRLEEIEKKKPRTVEKDEIIQKELDFLNRVSSILSILYVLCILMFAISPMLIMLVKYYQTNEVELLLPFLILYPFDPFDLKVYPFVYLHQFWSECIVCSLIYAPDLFFFSCCSHLRIQFKLLQHSLENVIQHESKDLRSLVLDDREFRAKFKSLVIWHQELIESANLLEEIFSTSNLLNILSSSTMICLTGFNITVVKDTTLIVTFSIFFSLSMAQVFWVCFFADLLTSASGEISDSIYRSKWYTAESKIGRSLLIMQIRSQEPCKLTAAGFADVNLNSFMRVMSTSWSYFALLRTMYGE